MTDDRTAIERVQWREEPDGFRYLDVDYRDTDEAQRYEVFRASSEVLMGNPALRSLVHVGEMEHDPMWFKEVKDATREFGRRGLRMAVLTSRKESVARIRMLGFLSGGDHAQPFADETEALAWLREA